jgi:probable HAF family extracellular repeat protein
MSSRFLNFLTIPIVKKSVSAYMTAIGLFAALALPMRLTAQAQYKVVDMGTFGGAQGFFTEQVEIINNQGAISGYLDTSTADPNFPNFSSCLNPDCFFPHAFQWSNGVLKDLGTLPGGVASESSFINDNGSIAGISYGAIDPLTGAPENTAVLWKNGAIINLGRLPGGNESAAYAVNNGGMIVGAASNDKSDPFSYNFWGTETRAVLWQNGIMQDLGTLGGPDAVAYNVNEQGQISGCSYTNSTPNSTTGAPTLEPFLWEYGHMRSLGSLGTLTDIGTFGGTNGFPNYMNDAGEVVGQANYPGDVIHRAFLWKDGVLHDLGTLDKCSTAYGINSKGQVVGASGDCGPGVHAFLWDNGEMKDLTKLIPPHIELVVAMGINDRGEIACVGRVAGDDFTGLQHVFVLIPATEEDTQTTTSTTLDSSPAVESLPLPHKRGAGRRYRTSGSTN